MPLHASTQLSCHTPAGVDFLRDAGFSRVVLAREMSRDEIAACTGRGVEIEVFVHGALCMSVSGQCYFSAMLGSRSGNRGACAQPCRLPFSATGKPTANDAALSLKDNCLADYITDLIDIGVNSLKIEGRMKRPEYVAAATAVYAAAARGETVAPQALEALMRVFSRTGFTDGYYTAKRGAAMFGTRRKEDVTAAAGVLGELAHRYAKETPRIAVTMDFAATRDVCTLTINDSDGHTVTVHDTGADKAISRPLDPNRAKEQLVKTGGTPYRAASVTVSIDEGLTLPMARINALRRTALEQLTAARSAVKAISFNDKNIPAVHAAQPSTAPAWLVRLADIKQYTDALHPYTVFLPLSTPAADIRSLTAIGQTIGIDIPRGLFGTEERVRAALKAAADAGAAYALCGNIGAISLAKECGLKPIGGFGLNITNTQALAFYCAHGLSAATLSMELTFPQMRPLLTAALPCGVLLYGHQPLMLTRHCPRQCAVGCDGCHHQGLMDRTGACFPVMCSGGCSELLNTVPLYWGDRIQEVPAAAFYLFHFTTETAEKVAQILHAYRTGATPPPAITRGLYRRGVE